jgi:hypothetical protein
VNRTGPIKHKFHDPLVEYWKILRKEEKTMKYAKPAVSTLGDAANLIELIPVMGKNSSAQSDGTGSTRFHDPAYDLDE